MTPRERYRQREVIVIAVIANHALVGLVAVGIKFNVTLALILALVLTTAGVLLWRRWRSSAAGQRWLLERELENPERRGFRKPSSVREVRLS